MKKLINDKLKLNSNKIKSPGLRSKWVYVCFRSEDEKQKGIETLNGYRWKGSTLQAKVGSLRLSLFIPY
jgi:tRNA (uracil-5-)-methyltransferase